LYVFLTKRALVPDVKLNSISGFVMLDGKVSFEGAKEAVEVWPATKATKSRRVARHFAIFPPLSERSMIEMMELRKGRENREQDRTKIHGKWSTNSNLSQSDFTYPLV